MKLCIRTAWKSPPSADINDEAQTITINPKGGLLIQKTSEDGVLKGFTFFVEGEGYSETFITDGAGKIYIEDLAPGEYTITEQREATSLHAMRFPQARQWKTPQTRRQPSRVLTTPC